MEAEREIETNYSASEFVAELRRLADTIEANEGFTIQIDGEDVVVPEHAIAAIAYEIEDGRAEIEFQLSWDAEEAEEDEEDENEEGAKDETEAAA